MHDRNDNQWRVFTRATSVTLANGGNNYWWLFIRKIHDGPMEVIINWNLFVWVMHDGMSAIACYHEHCIFITVLKKADAAKSTVGNQAVAIDMSHIQNPQYQDQIYEEQVCKA